MYKNNSFLLLLMQSYVSLFDKKRAFAEESNLVFVNLATKLMRELLLVSLN